MTVCYHCEEQIEPAEVDQYCANVPMHHECAFRSIVGSVAHIEQRCSCYVPGSTESDPPGMSKRQAAKLALCVYREREDRCSAIVDGPCIIPTPGSRN